MKDERPMLMQILEDEWPCCAEWKDELAKSLKLHEGWFDYLYGELGPDVLREVVEGVCSRLRLCQEKLAIGGAEGKQVGRLHHRGYEIVCPTCGEATTVLNQETKTKANYFLRTKGWKEKNVDGVATLFCGECGLPPKKEKS